LTHTLTPQDTVLVVEDDPWTRTVLSALLAGEGFAVLDASTGEAGLQLAQTGRPRAILLDLALPTLSGLDVLRELKRSPATAEIPVLIVSAYGTLLPPQDAPLVHAIVDKPFDYDELLSHVEHATGRPVGGARSPLASPTARQLATAGPHG
jgi:CheY-like chemotaxis protein